MAKPTDNTQITSNEPGVTYNGLRALTAAELQAIITKVRNEELAKDVTVTTP